MRFSNTEKVLSPLKKVMAKGSIPYLFAKNNLEAVQLEDESHPNKQNYVLFIKVPTHFVVKGQTETKKK